MSPSPGMMVVTKRTLFTFAVGVGLGFMLTYLVFSAREKSEAHRRLSPNQVFLPNSPHSSGETDHFVGPDKEQAWDDFHSENHHGMQVLRQLTEFRHLNRTKGPFDNLDEDTVAQELSSRVRVLCWVMTSPANLVSKARHVKATWGRRCNKLLFMSSKDDASLPAVGLEVPEGRDHLWAKTKAAFRYIHEHHLAEADWFLKADDDTYVVVENLRRLLRDLDAARPLLLGRRFKPYVAQGYMSGGAGYVLSKEAVKRFVRDGLGDRKKCRQDDGGAEDLEMGHCLERVGVKIIDSRDALGRETFHPFVPEHHLIPGLVPRNNWYWEYNYYPAKEGPGCCSDFAVTFHYVPPNMMYVFEYFIYHLKPFGVGSRVVLPSEKYRPEVNEPHLHRTPEGPGGTGHGETSGKHGTPEKVGNQRDMGKPRRKAGVPAEKLDRSLNDAAVFKDETPRTRVKLVARHT